VIIVADVLCSPGSVEYRETITVINRVLEEHKSTMVFAAPDLDWCDLAVQVGIIHASLLRSESLMLLDSVDLLLSFDLSGSFVLKNDSVDPLLSFDVSGSFVLKNDAVNKTEKIPRVGLISLTRVCVYICHDRHWCLCVMCPGPVLKGKVKFSHTRYRALGPELIPVYRQSARR